MAPRVSHATHGRAGARTGMGRELHAPVRPARPDLRAVADGRQHVSRPGSQRVVALERRPLPTTAGSVMSTETCRPPSLTPHLATRTRCNLCARARVAGTGHKCRGAAGAREITPP